MNLYDYLLAEAKTGDVAVIADDGPVTYGELIEEAERIGATLRHVGVGRGDRVGILAGNSAFWIAAYLGILKVGAAATPFPLQLANDRFRGLVRLVGCSAFCADPKHLGRYATELPPGVPIIAAPGAAGPAAPGQLEVVPIAEGAGPTAEVDDRLDLAALMFTSGSTGQPNAVKVSHRNIAANTDSIIRALGLEKRDRILVVLPFDYCFGTSLLHTHLRVGATLVLTNAFQYPEAALHDLERHACTEIAGVPLIYQRLLRKSSFPRRRWPHLRLAQQAGGKMADVFIKEFLEALPDTDLFVMYGQTEATARLSYLPPEFLPRKLGSIGRGLPGVSLHVLAPDGRPVAPGEVGEIVARGDNVALGYWRDDPHKQSFRGDRLFTGDLAEVDDDGFIFIVGRSGDFAKPMGHRVSCREIEDVVAEMPEVLEVAVRGVPDPDLGEVVKAYIVTTSGAEIPPARIRQFCKGRLADHAIPRAFAFLPELPKNGAQKVLKALLPA